MSLGVYVGRFNPIHKGHEAVIDEMVAQYGDNCLIIIGSCNAPQTMRHFFPYSDRRSFIKTLYPGIATVSLADFAEDEDWFEALMDILALKGADLEDVKFFTGCIEDIEPMLNQYEDISYQIVNRHEGAAGGISATEVRLSLLKGHSIDKHVNTKLFTLIRKRFEQRWKEFNSK